LLDEPSAAPSRSRRDDDVCPSAPGRIPSCCAFSLFPVQHPSRSSIPLRSRLACPIPVSRHDGVVWTSLLPVSPGASCSRRSLGPGAVDEISVMRFVLAPVPLACPTLSQAIRTSDSLRFALQEVRMPHPAIRRLLSLCVCLAGCRGGEQQDPRSPPPDAALNVASSVVSRLLAAVAEELAAVAGGTPSSSAVPRASNARLAVSHPSA